MDRVAFLPTFQKLRRVFPIDAGAADVGKLLSQRSSSDASAAE